MLSVVGFRNVPPFVSQQNNNTVPFHVTQTHPVYCDHEMDFYGGSERQTLCNCSEIKMKGNWLQNQSEEQTNMKTEKSDAENQISESETAHEQSTVRNMNQTLMEVLQAPDAH